jgi:hypothetical protein
MATCTVPSCNRPFYGHGLCQAHWRRRRHSGEAFDQSPIHGYRAHGPVCEIDTCDRPYYARGLCNPHYARLLTGDINPDKPFQQLNVPLEKRLWSRIVRSDDPTSCWLWTGRKNKCGYGTISVVLTPGTPAKSMLVHRVVYMLTHGDIPEKLTIDHTCHTAACTLGDNCPHRACCNVHHLELATPLQNWLRGNTSNNIVRAHEVRRQQQRAQTHCKYGHLLDEINTYRNKNGHRSCKACRINARLAKRQQR